MKVHDDRLTNRVQYLEKESKELEKSIKFVPGEDKDKYEDYIKNLEELFSLTGVSIHLVNICRAEKKMYGSFTPLAKKSAMQSFERNKNEKTLYYALETSVGNSGGEEAKKKLEEIFSKVKNGDLENIKNIYLAGIAAREGDFLLANRLLYRFRETYSGKVLWQSKFIITEYSAGSQESNFMGNGDDVGQSSFSCKEEPGCSYVISVSCNKKYFDLYGKAFLASVKENCREEALVHISFVNVEKNYAEARLGEWGVGLKVVAKYFFVEKNKEVAASATARLFMVNSLLKNFNSPVFFCEIDSAIVKSLTPWINKSQFENVDQVVRVVGSALPWRMFTCGFGLFLPTDSGMKASLLLSNYCKAVFNSGDRLVWADQAVLEGAIRYSSLVDGGYKISTPKLSEIKSYIVTPTGSHDKKKKILSNLSKVSTKTKANVVQVVGLQRSGTNFLSTSLEQSQNTYSVVGTGDNFYTWKHALPREDKKGNKEYATVLESVVSNKDLRIILLSKHPLWWLSSILNRNPADLMVHRKNILDENGKIDPLKSFRFYLDFYKSWKMSFEKNKVIHVRYEDFLGDFDQALEALSESLGMVLVSKPKLDTMKVKYSKGSFSEKRDLYMNSELDLEDGVITEIKKSVSEEDLVFLGELGYNL